MLLIQMNIHLREGDTNTYAVELLLHMLMHIKISWPVIFAVAEGAASEVDRTVAPGSHKYALSGVIQYPGTFFAYLQDGLAGLVDAVSVTDTKSQLYTKDALAGNIGNDIAGYDPIRDENTLIVQCLQDGIKHLNAFHSAVLPSTDIHQVPNFIGFENEQHHTAGKMPQASLKGQADGEGQSAEDSDEGGGLNTKHTGYTEE